MIYKTDKKPDEPCSITSSLSFFADEEGGDQNVTGPPRAPPTNLTVVTVEGCPSFVILDWQKSDNETRGTVDTNVDIFKDMGWNCPYSAKLVASQTLWVGERCAWTLFDLAGSLGRFVLEMSTEWKITPSQLNQAVSSFMPARCMDVTG